MTVAVQTQEAVLDAKKETGPFSWLVEKMDAHTPEDAEVLTPGEAARYALVTKGIELCSLHWEQFVRLDGTFGYAAYTCKQWHGEFGLFCDKCVKRRAAKIRKRIERAIRETRHDKRKVKMARVEEVERKQIVRKYTRADVLCCPLQDGQVLVFCRIDADDTYHLRFDMEDVDPDSVEWEDAAKTPQRQRMSGDLGKDPDELDDDDNEEKKEDREKNDEEDEEKGDGESGGADDDEKENAQVKVSYRCVILEGLSNEQKTACARTAILNTTDLNPETPEEYEIAIENRLTAYVDECKRIGGRVIYQHWRNRGVYPDELPSWDNSAALDEPGFLPPDEPPELDDS